MIDLRSDTVTKPSPAMREAMASAAVGDDVFGEDPTVNAFQEQMAEFIGKEAAIFTPTGVMANQLAIKSHTLHGDEIIVEADSHIFHYETAGAAFLSGVQMFPIHGKHGVMAASQIASSVRTSVYYMPKTALICLENTHNKAGGTIYPLEEIISIRKLSLAQQIPMHLDGARLWNAWTATAIHPKTYAQHFDSVSVCFSKGLGAPVGSMLLGTKSLIEKARKYRKIFGGGMRQVGVLAAAARYAFEHHVNDLKHDHEKAKYFAEKVAAIPGLCVDLTTVQTNIVIMETTKTGKTTNEIIPALRSQNLLLSDMGTTKLRAVMHRDVTQKECETAVGIVKQYFGA